MSINSFKRGDVVMIVSGVDGHFNTDVSVGDLAFVESELGDLRVFCRRTGRFREQVDIDFKHVRQTRVEWRTEEVRRARSGEVIALPDQSESPSLTVRRVGTEEVFTLPAEVPASDPAPFAAGGGSFGGGGASGDWSSPVSDAGGGFGGDAGASVGG